jgi:PST family polysaccharide transporter
VSWFAVERPTGKIAAQVVAFGVSRGVLLLATVVTARSTNVAAYGVFALALVVFQAGILLRDAGLGQALIILGGRERGQTLMAAMAISALGLALALVMWLFAEPLTSILGLPAAAPSLRILALAFGIGSIGIASNATLERELRFLARSGVDVISYSALGLVTVFGLARGVGVESLAWGFVAQAILQSVLGVVLAPPWRDRGGSLAGLGRVVRYSGLLWASAGLSYLAANIDNVLVARLAGAAALGVYALSYTIGNTVTIGIAQVLNRVALPYYGRDHDDRVGIERTVRTVIPLSVVLAAIPTSVIIAMSPEIGQFLFSPGTSVLPLTLLAVYGAVRALAISLGTALNGVGAARETVVASVINVVLMTVAIPAALSLAGPTGVAAVVLVGITVSSTYLALIMQRRVGIDLGTDGRRVWIGFGIAVAAALLVPDLPLPIRLIGAAAAVVVLLDIAWRITGLRVRSATPRDAGSPS